MKRVLLSLAIGLALGAGAGWYAGYHAADANWQKRALTGVAVDCYDVQGNLVPDTWGEKFGSVRTACAPGQTARVHQPNKKQ
jgi:hypothetical protein